MLYNTESYTLEICIIICVDSWVIIIYAADILKCLEYY